MKIFFPIAQLIPFTPFIIDCGRWQWLGQLWICGLALITAHISNCQYMYFTISLLMTSERFEQFVRWKEFLLRWSKILEWRKAQNSSVSACRTKWLKCHAAMLGGLALIASHRLCFVAHCTCRWFNFLVFLFLVFIVYVIFFVISGYTLLIKKKSQSSFSALWTKNQVWITSRMHTISYLILID